VRGITLFLLGGITQLSREPPTAGAEFRIAAAGPLVSLMLALGLNWFGSLVCNAAWVAPVLYLGRINLLLAGFNLLPGFPLDGGRLLRALLWAFGCDVARATQIAAQVGLVIASLFILGGFFQMFNGQSFTGLWIVFVGWFLYSAAVRSWQQGALRGRLQGLRAAQIMNRNYALVEPDLSLEQLMSDQRLNGGKRSFMVADATGFAGMLTLPRIRALPRQAWPVTSVGQAMTAAASLQGVSPSADLAGVFDHMVSEEINQVPVVEQGRLVGLVEREELLALGQRQSS
jgi:CBS domain-containing protein